MSKPSDNDLFYTCSLVEYIGRKQKLRRGEVVKYLGKYFRRIYFDAPILHCEPIAKVADEFIELCQIPTGDYDNIGTCKYRIPDYWDIGDVFERLIHDVNEGEDIMDTAEKIYDSWVTDALEMFNTDFYYQSRECIYETYRAGGYID